jgi:hypothetical protein
MYNTRPLPSVVAFPFGRKACRIVCTRRSGVVVVGDEIHKGNKVP